MKKFKSLNLSHLLILFCTLTQGTSFADQIVTADGSEINGELILFEDGNLTFQTKFAGKIRISIDQINSLSTDNAISIRLDDNRTFESKVLQANNSQILIEENQLTPAFSEVRHLWPSEKEDPLLDSVVAMITGEFQRSEYTDFNRFWLDENKKYKDMLKDKYDVVGKKLGTKLQK